MKIKTLTTGAIAAAAIALCAAGEEKMKITSSAFQQEGNIPAKFTCDGGDASPGLHFEGVPPEAKSLVLIVDDPDAPSGLFTHWLIWNIDPKTIEIGENSPPAAVQGKNDFGKSGYGGPCPPSGTHRYFFKVYALDQMLSLKAGGKRADLDRAMKGHVVRQAELMGRYSKQK
jgi:Raf kinase inhibitor-like YbhB/YbcL family protein